MIFNLYAFFLNLLLTCPHWLPFLQLTFNLNICAISRHDHPKHMTILHPQCITIPMHIVCHSQLIYSFIQNQDQYLDLSSFLSFSCTPHIALTMVLFVICKIPILLSAPSFTSMLNCWLHIMLLNSLFQLQRKPLSIRLLATFPRLHPPIYCSGSKNSLASTTFVHTVT